MVTYNQCSTGQWKEWRTTGWGLEGGYPQALIARFKRGGLSGFTSPNMGCESQVAFIILVRNHHMFLRGLIEERTTNEGSISIGKKVGRRHDAKI